MYKLFTLAALILALRTASALPTTDANPVPNGPITVLHLPGRTLDCNGRMYTDTQIYSAIAYGVHLQEAGQTRGKSQYPESFRLNPGGANLHFPSYCPENDANRRIYPIKSSGIYDGGPNNANQGNDRVVYMHSPGETDKVENHFQATYCGVIRHPEPKQTPNGFVDCT